MSGQEALYLSLSHFCVSNVFEHCQLIIVIVSEPLAEVLEVCHIFNGGVVDRECSGKSGGVLLL